jgi:hypothetical protein
MAAERANKRQALETTTMQAHGQQTMMNRNKRSVRAVWSAVCGLALSLSTLPVFAGQHGAHPAPPPPHMSAPRPTPQVHQQQPRPQSVPQQQFHPQPGQGAAPRYNGQPQNRPGQQGHLPEWLNNHQNLTPKQQEDALRREPGFNRLPQDQQQRLVNRLQTLNSKPPQERQRILQRNEMFEHLSPEQKAGVRGASQSFHQMPPDRQGEMRRAFQDLRGIPPEQRLSILNSARFQHQFSPSERTVLGNLLSVEPYQPR